MLSTWHRLLARATFYDLSLVVSVVPVWALLLGVADWRVVLGLTLVRVVTTLVWLRREFAELAGPRRELDDRDSDELLKLDAALQRGPRRLARLCALGWAVVLVSSTALGLLGLPARLQLGDAELFMAGLVLMAILGGVLAIVNNLIEPVLLEDRAAVGAALADRGLDAQRRPSTIVGLFVLLNVPITMSVFFGMSGLAGMGLVEAWRATDRVEQQRRVERGARAVKDAGELDEGLRVVEASALPEVVGELGPGDEGVAETDVVRGLTVAAAPIGDGRWVVAEVETEERLGLILAFVLGLPLFFVPGVAAANWSVSSAIAKQLAEVRGATQRVLEAGEIRDIGRFRPPSNDEVGALIRDFNGMLDVLEELADAAHLVSGGNLTVELDRPGDLHDAFRGMLGRLRETVAQIRATALDLASAASELQAVAQEQARVVNQQSRTVAEVGGTVELLANAAHDITQTAEGVLDNAEQTLSTTDEMVGKITELSTQANGVSELLELIEQIADRSDLLALNGSLEATRAGEAGRGFALVAAEMRRLAERVSGTVADVRGRVIDIKNSGTSTVIATEGSRKLAERTAAAAREISTLTAAQGRDTQRASAAMLGVSERVIATGTATEQTRIAAERLKLQADELERLTRRFEVEVLPSVGGSS
ncbi:Frizzy aggregation protein FrzCD [Enhygromyxa salina]|uniref:Frizzy aggregation protein FrzCD n=1 Tax=Enhygromyxa salina TaxID=215803 RepID=A0A2S9XZK1_9BACT|nr:methyl-accepting chemotaxis protein [Enhygromyxa salina]PRP98276.1 Frizzy aggregation protein FrzCD [Enhygromyxa salina]